MADIPGGGTFWARQTIESKIFYDKPDKWFKIWFYLISKVNHQDNKQFKRGSCFMRYDWITDKTKATKDQIKHCLSFFRKSGMCATQKATRGFTITVLNYAKFQSLENYKSHTKSQMKATQKPHRSHTIYNKNDKNDKNDKNTYSVFFEDIYLKYPNKFGKKDAYRHFKASVKSKQDLADIKIALDNYLLHLQANTWKKPQNASTWFNNWQDWVDIKEQKSELEKVMKEAEDEEKRNDKGNA